MSLPNTNNTANTTHACLHRATYENSHPLCKYVNYKWLLQLTYQKGIPSKNTNHVSWLKKISKVNLKLNFFRFQKKLESKTTATAIVDYRIENEGTGSPCMDSIMHIWQGRQFCRVYMYIMTQIMTIANLLCNHSKLNKTKTSLKYLTK